MGEEVKCHSSSPLSPFQSLRALLRETTSIDGSMPVKLNHLKKEEGTWLKVAVRLGVTERELKNYRYYLNVVPSSKWKERQDVCEQQGWEGYWAW